MNYPRCGMPADAAFVLSYDVICPISDDPRLAQARMADRHLQSGLMQFSDVWLPGVAAVLTTNLAKKVVVVGGYEARYPNEKVSRPEVIKALLQVKHTVDPARVECAVSAPNTIGNAETITTWIEREKPMERDGIVISAYWHCARAALDIMQQGIVMPVIPAEAVWLASSRSMAERNAIRRELVAGLGFGDFAERVAGECNGIADKLTSVYQSLSERTKVQTAA